MTVGTTADRAHIGTYALVSLYARTPVLGGAKTAGRVLFCARGRSVDEFDLARFYGPPTDRSGSRSPPTPPTSGETPIAPPTDS